MSNFLKCHFLLIPKKKKLFVDAECDFSERRHAFEQTRELRAKVNILRIGMRFFPHVIDG
jgi:hypothetical protein